VVDRSAAAPSTERGDALALAFAAAFPTLAAWLYFIVFPERETLLTVYTISKVIQFSFPLAWTMALRRGKLPRLTASPRALLEGLGSGLAVVMLLFAAYVALQGQGALLEVARPRVLARVEAIGAATPVRFLVLALLLSVVHAFLEEYYWRWFVFGRLQARIGYAGALVVSSLAFMSHHVIILHAFLGGDFWPATLTFSAAVAAGGALWAWLYRRCRLLAGPWISHMLVDLAILGIGYDLIRGYL
jgi:membrane protease YdiL (CAAX protease family)